jgi:hypothetical protein
MKYPQRTSFYFTKIDRERLTLIGQRLSEKSPGYLRSGGEVNVTAVLRYLILKEFRRGKTE